MKAVLPILLLFTLSGSMPQLQRPAPQKIQVAEGIFLFKTQPYGSAGLDGNSIVILSEDGVLVFDSNGTPSAASAVLAEIRKLSPQPVRYVVNSHWHWDHWYGTEVYAQAFPNVQIVTHEKTRQMMAGPALDFNRPGLEKDLPGYIQFLENKSPQSAELAEARFFLEQKTNVHHTLPNVTFTDQLTVHLGRREIRIMNYGRAATPGDTFVYLPNEKILIAGDLLINPISFALSCYPTEWLRALEKLDTLDVSTIVPGHGDVLHDKELLHATMDLFRELLKQGKEYQSRGVDVDTARKLMAPTLTTLKNRVTHGDTALSNAFDIQLVDWYLHRVYDELNGPLTDAIAPIPPG